MIGDLVSSVLILLRDPVDIILRAMDHLAKRGELDARCVLATAGIEALKARARKRRQTA